MKKIILVFCTVMCGSLVTSAQQTKDEIQMVQSVWGMEKRAIVTDYMKLTAAEGTNFWPVYEAFQNELRKLGSDRILLVSDYANNLTALSNEKADELAVKLLKNNLDTDKLQKKYYGKMKKAVGSLRALSYMQLEYYIQTTIRSEIQNSIPFIGELDQKIK